MLPWERQYYIDLLEQQIEEELRNKNNAESL